MRLYKIPKMDSLKLGLAIAIFLMTGSFANPIARSKGSGGYLAEKPSYVSPKRQNQNKIRSSILVDSILSVIQAYYVDLARVENADLLRHLFSGLDFHEHISARLTKSGAMAVISGKEHVFKFGAPASYDEMLDVFVDVDRAVAGSLKLPGDEARATRVNSVHIVVNSLLTSLDAHSNLLDPQAYTELRQGTEGSFGGLGILVGIRDDLLTVIKPIPRSPASRIGIRKADKILSINGVNTYGFGLDDLVEYMRGEPGTKVELDILRDGSIGSEKVGLKREIINVDSVTSEEIAVPAGKVLQIAIESFSSRTSMEVMDALSRFRKKNKGVVPGVILDLRSNPGGLLDQAVKVADIFLKRGNIVLTKGRRNEVESASLFPGETDFPMVVLIDGESASASEIVAGALQDLDRAIVIGQPSFGKGSVQTIFELPEDSALKLTIARYYTPSGRSIQNVGIIPDIWFQPIFDLKQNRNLLGDYRYRNERFLRNHLATDRSLESGMHRSNLVKGFYLKDPKEQFDSDMLQSQEMTLAKTILNHVVSLYGPILPEGNRRAGHWVAVSWKKIMDTISKKENAVEQALANRFKVDWKPTRNSPREGVDFRLTGSAKHRASPGDKVLIPYAITNSSAKNVGRISLFVRSEQREIETYEKLIGVVGAGKTSRGLLEFEVPRYLVPGSYQLDVGMAVDGRAANVATRSTQIEILSRATAEISISSSIGNEVGGSVSGVLEPKEVADIFFTIENKSSIPMSDVKVKITSFSGKQVQVSKLLQTIKLIGKKGKQRVSLQLKGGKFLVNSRLMFGIEISSKGLKAPIRKVVAVKAKPTIGFTPKSLFAH